MTDTITKVTLEGRNETIVRLWTSAGNQHDLRPTDPDRAFQADYAAKLIQRTLSVNERLRAALKIAFPETWHDIMDAALNNHP